MTEKIVALTVRVQTDVFDDEGKLCNRKMTPEIVIYENNLDRVPGLLALLKQKGMSVNGSQSDGT